MTKAEMRLMMRRVPHSCPERATIIVYLSIAAPVAAVRSEAAASAVAGRMRKITRIRRAALITATDDLVFCLLALFLLPRLLGKMTNHAFKRRVQRASGTLCHLTV